MSQKDDLIALFKRHDYRLTLSQILSTQLAAEYRARMTDLRKNGFMIICEKGKRPSDNTYTMIAPEESGQMRFA